MKRFLITSVAAVVASMFVANAGVADGPDDLRAKAERPQREAEMLFRQAEEMERQHHPGPRHHDPSPIDETERRIDQLNERIGQLHHEGRDEEAKVLEREVATIQRNAAMQRTIEMMMERRRGRGLHHHAPPRGPEHRANMLKEAADHMCEAARRLRESGVHELADDLEREAERVREEAREQMEIKEAHEVTNGLRQEIGRLRHDLDRLRDELNELREHVPRR